MRKIILGTAILACAVSGRAQTNNSQSVPCSAISLGVNGSLNGFIPSPNDAWHQNISASLVDLNSTNIMNNIGANHLHHDWSNAGGFGIPYTVVDSSKTPSVAWNATLYGDDSDIAVYPLTPTTAIEGNPAMCTSSKDSDYHVIVVDKNKCVVHEMWQGSYCPTATPTWTASNGNMWDMTESEQRPIGMTSADAAGLSIFEGLVRYDEIQAGVINHALRFTTSQTRCDHYSFGDGVGAFVPPATHTACTNSGSLNIMGMRIRLKASFDISKYSAANQVILTAMKNYGMILADNGSSLFFQGTPDSRWNDEDLQNLDKIANTAFEVVQMPAVQTLDRIQLGVAPVIKSFTASSTTISVGDSVTLTPTVTGASYMFINGAGMVRGAVTLTPTATTTYTLTARNANGSTTSSVTVTVKTNTANLHLAPVATQTYGGSPFTVNATSLSAGKIAYSVASGPAIISGSTVTTTGAGTVVLQASQEANEAYPATTVQTTVTVNPAAPTLALNPIATQTYGVAPFTVSSASNSSGGNTYSVVSGPATISGNTVTLTGVGNVTVQVSQAAAGNYAAATATGSFAVNAMAPKLAFASVANQTYGAGPVAVSASSASPAPITYSVVSGPASLLKAVVTLTGGGTVVLQASQAASGVYAAATATTSFTVSNVASSSVSLSMNSTTGSFPMMLIYKGTISVSGKVQPTGTVSVKDGSALVQSFPLFQYQNGVVQGMLITLGRGQHALSLSYSGDANYAAGQSATTTVTIK